MKKFLLVLLLLFTPTLAFAAIAFDAQSNTGASCWTGSNGTTCSDTHTSTGSNRLAIVGVYCYAVSGTPTVTGVTYAGSAMTKINSIVGTADAVHQEVSLWYIVAPSTSAGATITETSSSACQYMSISAHSYTGVDQTSPIDSNNTGQSGSSGSAAATSLTLSTTVVGSNTWLVGTVAARGGQPAGGTGTTLRGLNTSSWGSGGDSNATVGTGSQSLQWTSSNGAWPGGVIASIAPVAVASAVSPQQELIIFE